MSFLKIRDPVKRDQTVKEYLKLKKNIRDNLLSERTGNNNYKPNLQSFIDLLPKRKKLQRERLPKDLNLLEKVSRNYHKLGNLLVKQQEKKRKKKNRKHHLKISVI